MRNCSNRLPIQAGSWRHRLRRRGQWAFESRNRSDCSIRHDLIRVHGSYDSHDSQNVVPRCFCSAIGALEDREYLRPRRSAKCQLGQSLRRIAVPLPPLAEQHRIVARVDELMALCDQLEAQLTATEADSRRLLEAVLHEALAPELEETA